MVHNVLIRDANLKNIFLLHLELYSKLWFNNSKFLRKVVLKVSLHSIGNAIGNGRHICDKVQGVEANFAGSKTC